jgi:hypothetical protein
MKVNFSNYELLINNLVFLDGIGRSGKRLLSRICTSLKNFEQYEFIEFMENILPGITFNKVSSDFAKSFIVTTFNELAYNKLIGRKINFRPSDVTTVKNFKNTQMYEKRLIMPEGDIVVKKLKKSKNFFPYMLQDLMVNFHLIKKMNLNFKIIETYRNPFDSVYSAHGRGWGTRYLNDPRNFSLSLKYKKALVPWHLFGQEKKWLKMNPVQRCAFNVLDMTKRQIINHKKFKNKKEILTTSYEKIVEETNKEISRICFFLKTKKTNYTRQVLVEEKCPKLIDKDKLEEKKRFIKSNVSKEQYEDLKDLTKNYDKNIYNLYN